MEAGQRTVASRQSRHSFLRWEISLASWPRRLGAIALALIAAAAVETHVWGKAVAAWITRGKPVDPAVYERAIQYDPQNAAYHFRLAQLYNSTAFLDVARARAEYRTAVNLNPLRTSYWLEFSKFNEAEGDTEGARDAMQKALEADPQYAQTHWAAANLSIRQGDLTAADRHLRQTVDHDAAYTAQALDLAWRFYEDPEKVLATHIPDTKATNLTTLNYFIGAANDRGAALTWQRLRQFQTLPQERFSYVDYLISQGKVDAAWRVFVFPDNGSAFYNGGFETEALNGGFDWRVSSTYDASVRRDTSAAKEGLASLSVTFSGKENIDFGGQVWHWVPAAKGKAYELSFWMRTEGITTNEGMYVEIDGKTSEPQVGTTYWQQFRIPFTASADLVVTRIRRKPSLKFDNLLKGKVWLDGFTLAELR
jgi:hypothetical protein